MLNKFPLNKKNAIQEYVRYTNTANIDGAGRMLQEHVFLPHVIRFMPTAAVMSPCPLSLHFPSSFHFADEEIEV